MLVDPENSKRRVITPNDIANLFGDTRSSSSINKTKPPSDHDYDDEDEDFDFDMYDIEEADTTKSAAVDNKKEEEEKEKNAVTKTAVISPEIIKVDREKEQQKIKISMDIEQEQKEESDDDATIRELFELQEMATKPAQQEVANMLVSDFNVDDDDMLVTCKNKSDFTDDSLTLSSEEQKTTIENTDVETESESESELPYMDLNRVLDKVCYVIPNRTDVTFSECHT